MSGGRRSPAFPFFLSPRLPFPGAIVLCLCLSVCPSVCLPVYLSVSVRVSVCLCPSVYLSLLPFRQVPRKSLKSVTCSPAREACYSNLLLTPLPNGRLSRYHSASPSRLVSHWPLLRSGSGRGRGSYYAYVHTYLHIYLPTHTYICKHITYASTYTHYIYFDRYGSGFNPPPRQLRNAELPTRARPRTTQRLERSDAGVARRSPARRRLWHAAPRLIRRGRFCQVTSQ